MMVRTNAMGENLDFGWLTYDPSTNILRETKLFKCFQIKRNYLEFNKEPVCF